MDNYNVDELIAEASQFEEHGSFPAALACWQLVMDHSVNPDAKLFAQFGRVAQKAGHFQKAEEAFLLAIDKAPDVELTYRLLALLYYEQKRNGLAREQILKALKIAETPDSFVILGSCELRLGMMKLAQASFEKAIECDPTYEEAYYNLGTTYIHYRGE